MSINETVAALRRGGHLVEIDVQLAETIAALARASGAAAAPELALASAIASRQTREGHTCIDLKQVAGQLWPASASDAPRLPELEDWLAGLRASPAVAAPDCTEASPLVLDASQRLYLRRMWRKERLVADRLRELAIGPASMPATSDFSAPDSGEITHPVDHGTPMQADHGGDSGTTDPKAHGTPTNDQETPKPNGLQKVLDTLFPVGETNAEPADAASVDGQPECQCECDSDSESEPKPKPKPEPNALPRKAALIAATRNLCCISGGPGTGKTTTVAKIMAALMKAGGVKAREIAFAAPTGKAAARLQEATRESLQRIRGEIKDLPQDFDVKVSTIHRWLQQSEADRALVKVLIVDESSMIDIQIMGRLLEALPTQARLILLGDSHQLSSVQPGSVFADICGAGADDNSPLRRCAVTLTYNWRFPADSKIGLLATAINEGNSPEAWNLLTERTADETRQAAKERRKDKSGQSKQGSNDTWVGFEDLEDSAAFEALAQRFTREHYAPMVEGFKRTRETAQLTAAGKPFENFMALCAHRRGAFGSERFNRLVEQLLRGQGLAPAREEFYAGRPIIVTRNDQRTGLSNGDTGIVVDCGEHKRMVWFPDLSAEAGEPKLVNPQRLPPHESFYALTVHRSQGSEYREVAVIPGPAESPVNTRELLYTAVTRARETVVIHGSHKAVEAAIQRKTARGSGLQDALR